MNTTSKVLTGVLALLEDFDKYSSETSLLRDITPETKEDLEQNYNSTVPFWLSDFPDILVNDTRTIQTMMGIDAFYSTPIDISPTLEITPSKEPSHHLYTLELDDTTFRTRTLENVVRLILWILHTHYDCLSWKVQLFAQKLGNKQIDLVILVKIKNNYLS